MNTEMMISWYNTQHQEQHDGYEYDLHIELIVDWLIIYTGIKDDKEPWVLNMGLNKKNAKKSSPLDPQYLFVALINFLKF